MQSIPNMETGGYELFRYVPGFQPLDGWDHYASQYISLNQPNSVYRLTKSLMHTLISHLFKEGGNDKRVLDLNCGTGNDFDFFIQNGWKITGCDGSQGMLNKAYEKYHEHIKSREIELFKGRLEDLDEDTFSNRRFDLIFSVTGGFSYISDDEVIRINGVLKKHLAPRGKIITAHLSDFCFPDMIYNFLRFKPRRACLRLKEQVQVNIKGTDYIMHLRSFGRLKKLFEANLSIESMQPLLAFTPPYQSGYRPPRWLIRFHEALERAALGHAFPAKWSDQIVLVCNAQ